MTKPKRTTITLRFNETVDYSKLVKMAEQNNRSINSEILWAIQNRLKQFEIINSALCQPNIDKAIETYLSCVLDAKKLNLPIG